MALEPGTPGRLFISHATEDAELAHDVCSYLEGHGHNCWLARRDARPGREYGAELIAAIESSKGMVIVFSEHSNASPFVQREVERAVAKQKPVYLLRARDVAPTKALEFFLSSSQWIDAYPPPLDQHLARLLTALSAESSPGSMPPPSRARRPWWALAGGAAVILLSVGAWLLRLPQSGQPPQSPTTTPAIGVTPAPTWPTSTPPNTINRLAASPEASSGQAAAHASPNDSPVDLSKMFWHAVDNDDSATIENILSERYFPRGAARQAMIAQLRLAASQRAQPTRRLLLDARLSGTFVQWQLVTGQFALVRYEAVSGAWTVCENLWLERTSKWAVIGFYLLPVSGGHCVAAADLKPAQAAARAFLESLDHAPASVVTSLSRDFQSQAHEDVLTHLGAMRKTAEHRSGDRRVFLAFPSPQLPYVARQGDFVFVRFASAVAEGITLFEDVGLERQPGAGWLVAFFFGSPAPAGFVLP